MKFGFKYFWDNTPKIAKRIGNFLVGFSAFASAGAMLADYPKLAMVILIAGALGKGITQMFTEDKTEE